MDEKKQTKTQNNNPAAPPVQKGNNKVLFWILGGCLALLLIGALVIGGIAYLSWKKVKVGIKDNQQKMEQAQRRAEESAPGAGAAAVPSQTSIPEEPVTAQNQDSGGVSSGINPPAVSEEGIANQDNPSIYPPAITERAMGFIKKVYAKNGKNYLDVDYIQWLTGAEAEKAMREDGRCPKTGECIVYDDYYIRNQNPLIRTFEISPDVEITMQTYEMEATGQIHAQKINISQFSQIWNTSSISGMQIAPYHIGIGNKKILEISE
ncbi:MAG: hypothetical protein PHP25_05180, partial [Candidatus Moranbacteria bacterium]|nr:hypothetical protein [Candidatus Moranbacteria bacterium]